MRTVRPVFGAAAVVAIAIAATIFGVGSRATEAQAVRPTPAAADDIGIAVGRSISSRVVTIKFPASRGEPKEVLASAEFDRRIEAYWISVIGVDVKFTRDTEKQINRQLWNVKPSTSAGGKDVELRATLGIRDGSGEFDDSYEGSIDVLVTAVMSN